MKLSKIELTPPVVAISVAVGFAFVGFAAELYVSETGTYRTDDGVDHEAYTDLQAAIDVAAKSGDWIWVEDDFVCTSEATSSARLNIAKALTISSRSGKWENGISVKADSVRRCIHVTKTGGGASQVNGNVRLIGFDLSSDGDEVQYGAVYVADPWARFDLENSRVHGFGNNNPIYDVNHSSHPEIANSTIRNCIYEGNANLYSTGGGNWSGKSTNVFGCEVYDTVFRFNEGIGGGCCYDTSIAGCIVSNCTFVCNTNGSANVGGAMRVSDATGSFRCYDCNFVSNTFVRNITHGAHVRAYGRFERCKFLHGGWRQCSGSVKGYGTYGLTLVDCLVSNNVAEACGGVYNVYATNTVIACNSASASGYGGGAYGSYLVDCDLIGNSCGRGGGARECVLVDCRVRDNSSAEGGGAYKSVLTNCVVSGNTAIRSGNTSGEGGGLYVCTSAYCRVIGNRATHNGGGVYGGLTEYALIACNVATNNGADQAIQNGNATIGAGGGASAAKLVDCVISNNIAWYRGAGTSGGSTKNCRIVDNQLIWKFTWIGAYANGGAAVWGGTHINALISGNLGYGKWGSAISSWSTSPAKLYNCTVVGNTSISSAGGVDDSANADKNSVFVNSVVAQNTGKVADNYLIASNSYMTVAGSAGADVGCFYGNEPKLGMVEGFAYTPLGGSKCKNNALKLDWMTNETDVCSKDIYGHDRIMGSAPDIGAVERKGYGLQLLVR